MWDEPPIRAALEALEAAIQEKAKRQGVELDNLAVVAMANDRSVSVAYHGCPCRACARDVIGALATRVFGALDVHTVPAASASAQKVH